MQLYYKKEVNYSTYYLPTKPGWFLITVVLSVILFFTFCFRTVEAGQVGIVTRFGEVNRMAASGIALKLPWPVENLYKMDIRVQKEEQDSAAASSDLQDVNAKLALNYALDGGTALKVYKEIGVQYKERVIIPAMQESFKAASANYTASELITKRTEIKGKAYDVIKSRLEKYGIRVVDLNIVNFSFSPEFNKAIEAKQVAAQQAEQAKYLIEKAKNEAQASVELARGQSEANRLQRENLTPELLERIAIDRWDGKLPTYLGGGSVFNIPLVK